MEQLTEFQLDALKEICSIGAGNAATVISQMAKRKIDMSFPNIEIIPAEKIIDNIGRPQEVIAGVYCKTVGDFSSGFLLTFSKESAFILVDILLNRHIGKTKALGELEKSALQEMGNIIIGAFVNALSKIVNRPFFISVPKIAFDITRSVFDFLLIELVKIVEKAIVMEIVFYDVSKTIHGKFFILLDIESLEFLFSAIKLK